MSPPRLIGTDDWPDDAVRALLTRAAELKAGAAGRSLAGRTLIMVFLNPSLRTRTSFEIAMARHGGQAVVLEPGRGAWAMETRHGVVMDGDAVEHIVDAARVLGRYGQAVAVRAFPSATTWTEARRDDVVHAFARHSGVPTINLESARRHPCQGLADALTLQESFGERPKGRRFVLAWAWHPRPLPTAVPASAAIAAARLGMEVVIARPPGYDLDPDDVAAIEAVAGRNGGSLSMTADLDQAVAGADAVYAKSWGCLADYGRPEVEAARRAPLRSWIVDERRMASTRDGAGIFLHCLPVRRNVVVTDGVLDGAWSRVTDQAENRLHVQRAVLETMLEGEVRG
ncbi:MAG: N-acetylornithine carbamoyltransferase [Thermoanaerobaculales bacterium]|jgi:N-acetylornithine carbamoyltransferase|nr:N-acetylornithine carbamoyltransferase [Thermoanaerobaculales bacterium]